MEIFRTDSSEVVAKQDHSLVFAHSTITCSDSYIDGPYRDFLPDDGSVYFTHGDLTLTNIMVSGEPGSDKVKAIIDWEQGFQNIGNTANSCWV
jgi:hypothetical protein